jgi:hypothetical protein
MNRFTLDVEYDFDFGLLAISCHAKNYKFCWEVNQHLHFNFLRKADYTLKENNTEVSFPIYEYEDEENGTTYQLIENYGGDGYLLKDYKKTDFLLLIKGNYNQQIIDTIKNKLSELKNVLMVIELNPNEIKSKENLIF